MFVQFWVSFVFLLLSLLTRPQSNERLSFYNEIFIDANNNSQKQSNTKRNAKEISKLLTKLKKEKREKPNNTKLCDICVPVVEKKIWKNVKQRPFFLTLALCATLKWTTDLFANSKIKSEENHSLWFHMENIFTLFTTTRRGRRRIHLWKKNRYIFLQLFLFVNFALLAYRLTWSSERFFVPVCTYVCVCMCLAVVKILSSSTEIKTHRNDWLELVASFSIFTWNYKRFVFSFRRFRV